MNRRDFISISVPATSSLLLTPGFVDTDTFREIDYQFSGNEIIEEYDVIINGAGLQGYFAAMSAVQKGLKVLVVEKRPFPGYEITARGKLWINAEGYNNPDNDLISLFFPVKENQEIHRKDGTGPNKSLFGNELLLFAGSIKKEMLRNLLINKVHVLLMTDICGIFSDGINVRGVLIASKHGLYQIKCQNFIDASDNLYFSRDISGQKYRITRAGFVLEMFRSEKSEYKIVKVSEEFGIFNDQIILHPGKNVDNQVFLEFGFPVITQDKGDIEIQARMMAIKIGAGISQVDESLKNAQINNYALECSYYLADNTLPRPILAGYYMLPAEQKDLSWRRIMELQLKANNLFNGIKRRILKKEVKNLIIRDQIIPINQISFDDPDEPGLSIPLKRCHFNMTEFISNTFQCQVLVGGGGTSGSMAVIGALESGAEAAVVDYFNDLGGTRTMGGVSGYYHGMTENKIIKDLEKEVNQFITDINSRNITGRRLYLLSKLIDKGGKFFPGAIICDSIVNNKTVTGIVICRYGKLEIIKADITVDSTGDGDIAFFAGAVCSHGNSRTGKTQNYSQWNIAGGMKTASNLNGDYDIIDNTKISELQRGLFLSHYEAGFYDFYPYLTVRESRRVKGLYEINLIDAVEGTHFDDMISVATSDFDPHYVGNSEYTRCGFLLPHSNVVKVEIPFRSIVPALLDGLLISGKAFSQTQNAMQFTRMNADLTILGYLTGQIASRLTREHINPGEFNVSGLKEEWKLKGFISSEYCEKASGNLTNDQGEALSRINEIAQGKSEFLYDCCRLPKNIALPILKEFYWNSVAGEGKLMIAKALAWFGQTLGNELVEKELGELFAIEQTEGYPGGYIENYDFIRGRETNILKGLYWQINQNIALLAMAGNPENNDIINRILRNTNSGGKIITWKGDRADYFNVRLDLRIIPFFNRIFNLCFYAERVPDPKFIGGFENLLNDENIKDFLTLDYHLARWRIYGADLELYIGASLARCGSKTGYEKLIEYLKDLHYNFKNYALSELKSITKQDFGYQVDRWKTLCNNLTFPGETCKIQRDIEL